MKSLLVYSIISKKNGQKYVDSIYETVGSFDYTSQDYIEKRTNDVCSGQKYIETYKFEDWVQWSNEEDWKSVINITGENLKYQRQNHIGSDNLDSIFS